MSALLDLARRHTRLAKYGRQWSGLCPFHRESTPSFLVDPDKDAFYCLGGDTFVITDNGVARIREMAGQEAPLLTTGGQRVTAPIQSFGEQELWGVHLTRNGVKKTIRATPEHRWLLRPHGGYERTTRQLIKGHRLSYSFPRPNSPLGLSREGVAHGFVFGDGYVGGRKTKSSVAIFTGPKDDAMRHWFDGGRVWGTHGQQSRIGCLPAHYKSLPESDDADYLHGWLAGYFAADGTVAKDGSVVLSSASRLALSFVRDVAGSIGIGTYRIKEYYRLGYGTVPTPLYQLPFISSSLAADFFLLDHHRERFLGTWGRVERPGWVVEGVTPSARREEVFCAVVPGTHAFALEDNILTGNCHGCGRGGGLKDFARLVGEDTSTLPAPRPRPARRQPILMPWGWATGEEVLDYLAAQPEQEDLRASLGWPCPPLPEVRQCFESLIAQEAEQRFTEALLPD